MIDLTVVTYVGVHGSGVGCVGGCPYGGLIQDN